MLNGSYLARIDDAVETCRPSTLLYYPPRATHPDRIGPQGGRCLTISIAPWKLDSIGGELTGIDRVVRTREGETSWLATKLYRETRSGDTSSPDILIGLTLALSGHVARCDRRDRTRTPGWLERARRRLEEECTGATSLRALSNELGVHPVHLARRFREHFGSTPSEYRQQRRIERARKLLAHGTLPIARVGLRCGYADQSSFTRSFRRVTGMTPGRFRRLAAKPEVASGPRS